MSVTTPTRVELVYSVNPPNVLQPTIQVQEKLPQLIKHEAMTRFSRGQPLHFRLNMAGLLEIEVEPRGAGVPLPGALHNVEFVVRPRQSRNGSKTLKQVEDALLSEDFYPAAYWQEVYEDLVGLDQIKASVLTMLLTLFSPDIVREWCRKHHPNVSGENLLRDRYPVFIFEGYPGVGKTLLARSIGDPLARALGTPVIAYRVGLQVRGEGLVGQLSRNIYKLIEFARGKHQESGVPILLHVDEADAIAQSREIKEQHSEERAGLNTLLQQIDGLRDTPGVALMLTTNRPGALDVALRKRSAAHCITFPLPSFGARRQLLRRKFGHVLKPRDLHILVGATDGFAPRDIVELGNSAVMEAIRRDTPLTADLLLRAARSLGHSQPARRNGKALYSALLPQRAENLR
jgi:SpoVK/Ycf46/Vps4 family AAA+-type ATPase